MRERVSGRAIVDRLREQLPEVGETIQEFPQVIHAILQRAAEGRLQVEVKHPGIEALRAELRADRQQRWTTGAGGATLIGGVLWLGLDVSPAAPGWLLLVLGAGLLAFGRLGRPA